MYMQLWKKIQFWQFKLEYGGFASYLIPYVTKILQLYSILDICYQVLG